MVHHFDRVKKQAVRNRFTVPAAVIKGAERLLVDLFAIFQHGGKLGILLICRIKLRFKYRAEQLGDFTVLQRIAAFQIALLDSTVP